MMVRAARWSLKVSKNARDNEAKRRESDNHAQQLWYGVCMKLLLLSGSCNASELAMCTDEFLCSVLLWVRVRSTFTFIFGRKYYTTSGRHSVSVESHTSLSVLLSVSAESQIFTFRRRLHQK